MRAHVSGWARGDRVPIHVVPPHGVSHVHRQAGTRRVAEAIAEGESDATTQEG